VRADIITVVPNSVENNLIEMGKLSPFESAPLVTFGYAGNLSEIEGP